jgi:hypothetical protein
VPSKASDFLQRQCNGQDGPAKIVALICITRQVPSRRPMPVLFNENDHCDFDKQDSNFTAAVGAYASWGIFEYRCKGEGFDESHRCPPVNWGLSSPCKRGFFALLSPITGEKPHP